MDPWTKTMEGEGLSVGGGGGVGDGRVMGEKWGQLLLTNNKKKSFLFYFACSVLVLSIKIIQV